ncbi:PREDICTED: aspartic proteinase-like protein 2 isoform X2 [Lupinus angustifolius]|uniref:aspartic proteinase-like protein 2 isoform X2 n=1 Tax=Lupinus angustifolius TaxID=3871 RepID=UPI00092F9183|nr:PREDICTED: aspartic proteinase-like protein 2 isoform X2 [Lupinus angustifolius]XP_019452716.1 PREDICTED: aspartic proteinase-like protein 2 isoform X2 [Lupinus angustifolius]
MLLGRSVKVWLYYTTVHLGSPPREFHVDIDTGSDIPWVNCVSCKGCPQTSGLLNKLNYFDPMNSSTSSIITCLDHKCGSIVHSRNAACPINKYCSFEVQYVEGSMTSGYFVSDLLHLANIVEGSVAPKSSVPLFFGCSNLRTENLTSSEIALDGIFGFGKHEVSFISQLHSQGVAPKVFSHCLKGDISGGGTLVLGEAAEPNIVYSPLIPKQSHYNLNLESITINGQMLEIDPEVFKTSSNKGTSIDSGTTLAYFIEGVYNPIVDMITRAIPQYVGTSDSNGFHCYLVTNSVLNFTDIFPAISLNFANHASLVLRPQDYLLPFSMFNSERWCLGFHKTRDTTILGDIVLKDKIFVYDLAKQRIGWTNYNCSKPINVSPSNGKGRSDKGGALHLTLTVVLALLTHMIPILI